MPRIVLLHHHLFKNAGTTLDWILKRNFNNQFIDHRNNDQMRRGTDYLTRYIIENEKVSAISSHHMPSDLFNINNIHIIRLIMFRHPIERVLSVYNFERKQPNNISEGSAMASKKSFSDYVAWRLARVGDQVIKNYHIASLLNISSSVKISDELMNKALSKLDNDFLYGAVELFDKSLILMEDELKQYFNDFDVSYRRMNVTKKEKLSTGELIEVVKKNLPSDLFELLSNENYYDLKLYDTVLKRIDKKFESANLKLRNLEIHKQGFFTKLKNSLG